MKKPKITPYDKLEASLSEASKLLVIDTLVQIVRLARDGIQTLSDSEFSAFGAALRDVGMGLVSKGAGTLMMGGDVSDIIKDAVSKSPLIQRVLEAVEKDTANG